MAHKKQNLPQKLCAACQRPFAWRKKWAKVWPEVRYCSERCRAKRQPSIEPGQAALAAAVQTPK